MRNHRTTPGPWNGDLLPPIPFGPGPGWFEAYWYAPESPARARRRSLFAFIIAVLRMAMDLPGEIRRATLPCRTGGE